MPDEPKNTLEKVAAATVAAALVFLLALPARAAIIKGPYLQDLAAGSITVMWETDAQSASSVQYGLTPSLGTSISGAAATVHEVRLTGLSEGAVYYYKAVSGSDESAVYSFRAGRYSDVPFRFVAFGDSRSDAAVVSAISARVDALSPRPEFAVHTGDIVSDASIYSVWADQFFTPQHPMMARLPVFFSLGNHENGSQNYFDLFSLPGNERYYSFEYGSAAFIALDTESPYGPGSQQREWLEAELANYADKTWKFVFFHRPPYSTGSHGSDLTVRDSLRPLLERYHVNIVFNGHDHDYERSVAGGVTYVVTGGYGAPLYSQTTTAPESVVFAKAHHFCVADISGTSMSVAAISDSGSVLDSFAVTNETPPVSTILTPADGATVTAASLIITGTAVDPPPNSGVTKVELSFDGGATWRTASGAASWSYDWHIPGPGIYQVESRATDVDGNAETPGDSVTVTVAGFGEPENQHYFWDGWLSGGDCGVCHITPAGFLASGFRYEPTFCLSCHNPASVAHEDGAGGAGGHPVMVDVTSGSGVFPTYGNVTAGELNDQPYSRLKDGRLVVCVTCHNAMSKTGDFGRVWEMTSTSDNVTYVLQNGGWSAYGPLVPVVYRDTSMWAGPAYSGDRKRFIVDASEYSYDEDAGTITFQDIQPPTAYIYVTLGFPYLRVTPKDNALCIDCHAQSTHRGASCLTCHAAHGTTNIAGIAQAVRTPAHQTRPVRFVSLTGAGSFADGGAVYDGICEVCHTLTKYYRADGSGFPNHSGGFNRDGSDCTACHPHSAGFSG